MHSLCGPTHKFDYKFDDIIDLDTTWNNPFDLISILNDNLFYHATNSPMDIITYGFQDPKLYIQKNIYNQSEYSRKHLQKWNNQKMFGNGIYFADYISKAAKFSKDIIACEINFTGKNVMYCKYDTIPPKNIDCIIGLGKYNRYGYIEDYNRILNYYEYCVYDTSIIIPKYYIKIK